MSSQDGELRVVTGSWDWQTRVLHWVNALLVIALALLMFGAEAMEGLGVDRALRRPVKELHAYTGYVFVVTLLLRVLWGFLGNRYARWADLNPFGSDGRAAIARNIRWYLSGFKGRAARAIGHDPLASIFYIILFIVLITQAVTGVFLSGAEFRIFPGTVFSDAFGKEAAKEIAHSLEEVHEFGLWFVIFFLAAHLTGLVAHEVKEKTGLLSSMVHGRKYMERDDAEGR